GAFLAILARDLGPGFTGPGRRAGVQGPESRGPEGRRRPVQSRPRSVVPGRRRCAPAWAAWLAAPRPAAASGNTTTVAGPVTPLCRHESTVLTNGLEGS